MPQGPSATTALHDLVGLRPLMRLSRGDPEVAVGVVDGPVDAAHPGLAGARILRLGPLAPAAPAGLSHGTFVAGLLAARAGIAGICPGCTLLSRPIFGAAAADGTVASTADHLAAAIAGCIAAGARVVNVSAALAEPSPNRLRALEQAADLAAARGCLLVVAAGNQGAVGGSTLTRHPWVIAVTACDATGRPLPLSNFAATIGRGGIAAPGVGVASLAAAGGITMAGGTSAAPPFVSGAAALLASLVPRASGAAIRHALCGPSRRRSIVPPLLDAWAAYQSLTGGDAHGTGHRRTATA
jgi:hypothetical protein